MARRLVLSIVLLPAATTVCAVAWAAPQARAKSVIQIWLWGGPPHTDTFDPKPGAGYDYTGPLNKTIQTNVPGIEIGELLPLLAQQADKYSIIRSMTHGNNGHETAAYMVQTGRQPGGSLVFPSVGAVIALFKGYDHGYESLIPPYIVLTQTQGRFSEVGFLGPKCKPFATGGNPNANRFEVEGIIAPGISDERQQARRGLLHSLDTLGIAMPGEPVLEQLDTTEANAYDLILGEASKLWDLSQEPTELRNKYGRTTFGQSCLMARRLVEVGVPYITINYGGWDTHKQHFQIMRQKLPEMDRGFATLLEDLSDRGLLDTTIVWWGGEFGRGPRVDWEPPWNGGRNHYGQCFTHVVAGGGFKGGRVVGASNATGEQVAERPVSVQDLIGSIYELMGIDADGPLPNPRGEDIKVLPSSEEMGIKTEGRLYEIM
ncbi:MAG TPA: DUF1501 domain-containing protein [Armatimonadetes bacterium]|jgi:hypothetical protein|nr:DUF1501 domain-containing protein [Armatimonadota bacterium]